MSILSHEHRFLFIHVAKTGGRSVNQTLAKYCRRTERFNTRKLDPNVDVLGRKIALEIRPQATADQWNQYFKFAFVRNPWDRAVSMYRHIRMSREMNATGKMRYLDEITRRLRIQPEEFSFEVFVKAVLRDRVFDNYHWDQQIHCFTDESGRNLFDFIGRFESLQCDFEMVCRRIGFPLKTLPHHNRTQREHYSGYYTDETSQIVADVYRDDIAMFDYAFDDRPRVIESAADRRLPSLEKVRSHLAFHSRRSLRRLRAGRLFAR